MDAIWDKTHLIVASLTLLIFLFTGAQAAIYLLSHRRLKQHRQTDAHWPALQATEYRLRMSLLLSFLLLSLLLASSASYCLAHPHLPHALWVKTLLSGVVWLLLGGFLLGHHVWNWRGLRMATTTLVSLVVIITIYIGALQ